MQKFNEDTRVKIPATIQFLKIGYNYQSLKDDKLDLDFNTKIFINRFKPAIEKINHREISYDEIKQLLDEINNLIRNNDLGKEFYYRLINPQDKLRFIDFDNIENNDFAIVDELPFSITPDSDVGSFRPDINVLINGIPLASSSLVTLLITACGQTSEHIPHSIQFSLFQNGTTLEILRFSSLVVAPGKRP